MENFFIGYDGCNYISLSLKTDETMRKPEFLKNLADYLNFQIQYEGEILDFDLHVTQCRKLIEEIERFIISYDMTIKAWEIECKKK